MARALQRHASMSTKHTLVWLDHHAANVYYVQPDAVSETTLRAPAHHVHRHPKGATEAKAHPDDAKHFFEEIAKALEDAEEILLVGPGTAKLQFLKYVHKHQHALEPRIFGIETVDHPTDKQLVAYAKQYFKAADRMR